MPNNNRLQPVWAGLARNNRWSSFIRQKDVDTFNRRLEGEGAEFYARALGSFRTAFLTGIGEGQIGDIPGFGKKRSSALPRFLYHAVSRVFADSGTLLDVIDVDAVACVNQLTAVFTKLKGGHTPESEIDVIESFVATEDEIASTTIDEDLMVHSHLPTHGDRKIVPLRSVMDRASRLVRRVLAGSDPREISPKHGSGVSACRTEVRDRYAVPRYIEKIDRIWPMSDFYYASPTAFCDGLDEYLKAPEYDPCAKVLLVPKDARGPRLISCEPRETMWIQQGLMRLMYETIEAHPLTKNRVNFTRQHHNQHAAYLGSGCLIAALRHKASMIAFSENGPEAGLNLSSAHIHTYEDALERLRGDLTPDQSDKYCNGIRASEEHLRLAGTTRLGIEWRGKLATLDLKDASDRLRLDVVQRLLPPNWAEALTACRSGMTELPDGRVVMLHKHAPMGSAVCFPVMALVIWSLLTAIAPRFDRNAILVYGDDIIVPTYLASDAIQVLEAVGLRVNRNKSFTCGPFRESCGEEYVYGVRVTPVRLRTYPDDDAESLMSCMAFNNNMLESPNLTDNGWFLDLLTDWYGPTRVPIALQPSRKKVRWLEFVQRLEVGGIFRGITLSGVAFTNDPHRVRLPGGRSTRMHGHGCNDARKPAYHIRQYRIVVPRPDLVEYEVCDWSHVLRSLTEKSGRQLGLDTVHNRIRFKRQWVSLD